MQIGKKFAGEELKLSFDWECSLLQAFEWVSKLSLHDIHNFRKHDVMNSEREINYHHKSIV